MTILATLEIPRGMFDGDIRRAFRHIGWDATIVRHIERGQDHWYISFAPIEIPNRPKEAQS